MNEERRAIEALRAGVPNRAAIRLLGSSEAEIREQFLSNLQHCRAGLNTAVPVCGQIVAGGFGTGKSHLLGYLQELALQEDFIVSWISISKETPLFDPGKLLISAMRNAVVPKRNDDAMTAVLSRLKPNTDRYDELEEWASTPSSGLPALFPALLHLIPRQQATPERLEQIGRFFAGGKLNIAMVKQWLREAGAFTMFQIKPEKALELARQRLRFVPRLMAAAGYDGWCVLFDEVELVGRYSIIQRARSYAELARWLCLDAEAGVPGITAVAAITDDFTDRVIGDKRDDELAPAKLMDRGERENANLATIGIRELQSKDKNRKLRDPNAAMLHASLEKTRNLYEKAYAWSPPPTEIGDLMATKSIRQHMKSWITLWDLRRLYGTTSEIESGTVLSNYVENKDIEQPTDSNGDQEEA